ncbi:hypothetical protein [Thioclava kandeliae]|uniref:Uncharacterized protein n=1 Tax=Thioclava kandeliae TaxID=3070818 RepID=A0ABV1SMF0_9RHOB
MSYFLKEQHRIWEAIRELEAIISRRLPEEGAHTNAGIMRLNHALAQKYVQLEEHLDLCRLMDVTLPSACEVVTIRPEVSLRIVSSERSQQTKNSENRL